MCVVVGGCALCNIHLFKIRLYSHQIIRDCAKLQVYTHTFLSVPSVFVLVVASSTTLYTIFYVERARKRRREKTRLHLAVCILCVRSHRLQTWCIDFIMPFFAPVSFPPFSSRLLAKPNVYTFCCVRIYSARRVHVQNIRLHIVHIHALQTVVRVGAACDCVWVCISAYSSGFINCLQSAKRMLYKMHSTLEWKESEQQKNMVDANPSDANREHTHISSRLLFRKSASRYILSLYSLSPRKQFV